MAPIVIADAGPLIALAKLDLLHLLSDLFGQVYLPSAVQRECMEKDDADALRIEQAVESSVLVVKTLKREECLPLPRSLGDGEKEAITLATRYDKPLLVMVDGLARKQAKKLDIAFIGTVRLLDQAERKGVLPSAEVAIEAMREEGYRISLEILRDLRGNTD